MPLYYFPVPYLLASSPVIRAPIFSEDLYSKNMDLRVPIPQPWAHCLQLYESNSIPHTFACYIKYSRRGKSGTDVLAHPGSSWEFAFKQFTWFFKRKTGKEWADRFDEKPPEMAANKDGTVDEPFRYEPPKGRFEAKGLVVEKTRAEKAKELQEKREGSVTMVIPTIEISDDEDETWRKVQASTPPSGW
jgi:hypothetical protein